MAHHPLLITRHRAPYISPMSIPPQALAYLTQQFLDNYVPGVVRSRIVYDQTTAAPSDIYIDVATGHDPELVSRAVQRVMTDRFHQPVPPHHIHLRQTDEPQLRAAAEQLEEQLKRDDQDVQVLDASPELDSLPAEPSVYEFQRARASAWYDIRDAEIEAQQGEIGANRDTAPLDDFDAQREAFLRGDTGRLIVAHPDIRDALANSLLEAVQEGVLTPARQAGRDVALLQDTIFSEWLVLAAERLALPSQPFDEFPEDPYGVAAAVADAIALPISLAIAPSIVFRETATPDQRRTAIRDAVLSLVSLEDLILQPAFHDRFDPFAMEIALLLAWITLAAEHAQVPPEQITAALPIQGDPLDDLVQRASGALEQLCVQHGFVEPRDNIA